MTDLRRKRGDSIELAIGPVLEADGVTLQSLTGLTLRFTAKDRLDDLDAAAVLTGSTLTGEIVLLDQNDPATRGRAVCVIPGAQTAGFEGYRVLHWDVQLSDDAGMVVTLDSGKLRVEPDVTRTSP